MSIGWFGLRHRRTLAALGLGACLLALSSAGAQAQDSTNKANSLLENLQRRNAEERWQRMKKQYPQDRPGASTSQASSEQIPPAPEPLIPRLSALPVTESDDWVLPTRDPAMFQAPAPADAPVDQPAGGASQPVPVKDTESPQDKGIPVPQTNPAGTDEGPRGDVVIGSTRPLKERKIGDIQPYYDRTRDSDIRDFAVEKGREFGILFRPREFEERNFPELCMPWEAPNFFYHPLYFSDPQLERYGHSYPHMIQPIASIARFGGQFVMFPYQATIDPPCKEEYSVGWYRPGDCAPKLHYQLPLNAEAAVVEAAVITGLFFAIP